MLHKKIVKEIIDEMLIEKKIKLLVEKTLRVYMKDWDDNILFMPTKIKMDYNENGNWIPVDISTEDFARLRNKPNYRLRNNNPEEAFRDFKESEPFFRDIKWAIQRKRFAPSAQKFKEVLYYANPFAINTARGHRPSDLKRGVMMFIDMTFTKKQKKEMIKNIINSFIKEKRFNNYFISKLNELDYNQIIELYLDEKGEYYPVSSEEFGKKFGLDVKGGAANPEHAKKVAIANFVKTIWNDINYWVNSGHKKISFGFSDDDQKNVKAAEDFIRNELAITYPEIHFVVYDTSDNETKKIVISKKD
jgi:hypothetical protein